MNPKSLVKFRVRHNALALRRFTAPELAITSGLPESSVRTEISRMLNEGLIAVCPSPVAKPAGRGRPLRAYEIAPGGQDAIFESIQQFYVVSGLGAEAPASRPRSEHYYSSVEKLEDAQNQWDKLSGAQRSGVLQQILTELDDAEFEETLGHTGPTYEMLRAYIDLERARAKALAGDWKDAVEIAQQLRQLAEDVESPELRIGTAKIDECIVVAVVDPRVNSALSALAQTNWLTATRYAEEARQICYAVGPGSVVVRRALSTCEWLHKAVENLNLWQEEFFRYLDRELTEQGARHIEESAASAYSGPTLGGERGFPVDAGYLPQGWLAQMRKPAEVA